MDAALVNADNPAVIHGDLNPSTTTPPSNSESVKYLTALIGRTLRITTSDTRLFVGEMKCTDKVYPSTKSDYWKVAKRESD
jgi:hypothetical protein